MTVVKDRLVIAHKEYINHNNTNIGVIKSVAEIDGTAITPLSEDHELARVFIKGGYGVLEEKFESHELFRTTVYPNEQTDTSRPDHCLYTSVGDNAEPIKPKDLFEIIQGELPDPNVRKMYPPNGTPSTEYVFVQNKQNEVFGPFEWTQPDDDDSAIKLRFVSGPLLQITKHHVYTFPISAIAGTQFSHSFKNGVRQFTTKMPVQAACAEYDYASDTDVVGMFSAMASLVSYRNVDQRHFQTIGQLAAKDNKIKNKRLVKARVDRFIEITTELDTAQNEAVSTILEVLKTNEGAAFLERFINSNTDKFLGPIRAKKEKELDKELEAFSSKINEAKERLSELEERKLQVLRDMELASETSGKTETLQNEKRNVDKELTAKRDELQVLTTKCHEAMSKLKDIESYEMLLRKIDDASRKYKDKVIEQNMIDRDIEQAQKTLGSKQDELRTKLLDMKPFVDALNGVSNSSHSEKLNILAEVKPLRKRETILESQTEIVQHVTKRLLDQGRSLADHEVANMLLALQQSFFTVFAGLPGVGKTSCARAISKAQSLENRFHEVPVARGWTSAKDLLGFHNPLAGRFQASDTGLYHYLAALNDEQANGSSATAYVLLDEANLSPMEHYLSKFMGISDNVGSSIIHLGEDKLIIPEYLRFIATINYDATTEEMSQRLIDRSTIIVMRNSDLASPSTTQNDKDQTLPIAYADMERLFGRAEQIPDIDESEDQAFNAVRETLSRMEKDWGRPVHISPRKEIAIKHYCHKGRALISSMRNDSRIPAMDYAILQHVLPLVNGSGRGFAKRMEELVRVLTEHKLTHSMEYAQDMIDYGRNDMETYSFFCW